jgi:hypothetical protein
MTHSADDMAFITEGASGIVLGELPLRRRA